MPGLCQSSRALSRAGIGSFLQMGLFCVGCMQGVVEMHGGREFFLREKTGIARWVLGSKEVTALTHLRR